MRGTVSLLELISKSFLAEIGSSRPQMYLFREMLSKWYAGSNPEDPRLQRVLITAKTRAESILPACLELWMQLFMNPNQSESFATIPQRRISTLWYNLRLLWGCVLYNLVGCVECFFFFLWPLHYPVCKCGGQNIKQRRRGSSWVQVHQGKGEVVCTDVCKVPKKGSYKRHMGVIFYRVMYSS